MKVVLTNPEAAGPAWSPKDLIFEVREDDRLVVRVTGEEAIEDADALGLWSGPGRTLSDLLGALERQYQGDPPSGTQPQRLERLIALTTLLVRAAEPLALDDIRAALGPHYGAEGTHGRTLRRDLELIEQAGLGLEREGARGSHFGLRYLIAPERFALALQPTPAQRELLELLWSHPQGDPRGPLARAFRTAMLKFACGGSLESLQRLSRDLPRRSAPHPRVREEADALARWVQAWLERRLLGFGYGDPPTPRRVGVLGFFVHDGFFYGVGREQGHEGPKTFKLLRVRAPVEVLGSCEVQGEVFDMRTFLSRPPWSFGPQTDVGAVLEIDEGLRARLAPVVGPDDLVALGGDRHRLRVRGADGDALFAWLIQQEGRARLVDPPELRAAFGARLEALRGAYAQGRS